MGLDRFVKIESDESTGRLRVIDPRTGNTIPGVYSVTVRTHDNSGKLLALPMATIELYARIDVVAALAVLPKKWPAENGVPVDEFEQAIRP
jgi:hypothetical protein